MINAKKIEENNRMAKTRALFKKISDTKGTFHAKMGSIKDRNGMDVREAEDIKKRWQEYTVEVTNRFKGLDMIEYLMNYGQRFVTLYRR